MQVAEELKLQQQSLFADFVDSGYVAEGLIAGLSFSHFLPTSLTRSDFFCSLLVMYTISCMDLGVADSFGAEEAEADSEENDLLYKNTRFNASSLHSFC